MNRINKFVVLFSVLSGFHFSTNTQKYTDYLDPPDWFGPTRARFCRSKRFVWGRPIWDWCSGYNYRDSVIIGFPQGENARIMIDLQEGVNDKPIDTSIELTDKYTIKGYQSSEGWAKKQQVFFAIKSSLPITDFVIYDGNQNPGYGIYPSKERENLSPVSSSEFTEKNNFTLPYRFHTQKTVDKQKINIWNTTFVETTAYNSRKFRWDFGTISEM
jgi:hypothetical protein